MSTWNPPPNAAPPAAPTPDDLNPASSPPPQMVAVSLPVSRPYVTYALIAVSVLVYAAQVLGEFLLQVDVVLYYGAKINEFIQVGQFWRLFTPMFLHGSLIHLLFNMYTLYQIGQSLERPYGHFRFLLLYGVGGFTGNVLSFLLTPAVSVGSSTAVFGLLAAEGIFIYRHRQMLGPRARPMLNNVLFFAGINLLFGLSGGIDNWGHVGGMVGGVLFAWFAGPLLHVRGMYPNLQLTDERENPQAIWTALGVGGLFAALVIMKIFFF